MEELLIIEEYVGKRLDEVLVLSGAAPSRSKAKAMIEEKDVLVNNKSFKPSYTVTIADRITYKKYTNKPLEATPQNIELNIVYEDDDILIINKPRGLIVHPGNGHQDGTLVNALTYRYKDMNVGDDPLRPGIVHRIDKDTSGLLAVAKTDKAFVSLTSQLKDHSMHREYYALVMRNFKEDSGKIVAPLARDPKNPLKYRVDLSGKEAITYFEVKERFGRYTLLSCRLLTGRTHQIRVHMEYIGHPIVGDPLYGNNNCNLFKDGQLLHAYKLILRHPSSDEEMTFTAEIPQDFSDILNALR